LNTLACLFRHKNGKEKSGIPLKTSLESAGLFVPSIAWIFGEYGMQRIGVIGPRMDSVLHIVAERGPVDHFCPETELIPDSHKRAEAKSHPRLNGLRVVLRRQNLLQKCPEFSESFV
jgi:hypothetical protein